VRLSIRFAACAMLLVTTVGGCASLGKPA